ncbi:MAG TPA: c-type cytochrome [Desulfuromonadales bacterium]|nr:c-type cytochrome [Desulfuromonadales bacterium]
MEKAVLRKLTVLCIICGLAGIALVGTMVIRDDNREWKPYQADYKEQLLKKISRDRNPAFYERVAGMQPEVRQVVIDEWGAVDRCVSCHVGIEDPLFADARQPFTKHPNPELLKNHPVEKYGCTICHGGQGLSTTFAGAAHKSIAHWPVPMVSKGLMQSRCGVCHKDFEAIGADRLIKGREIFKEMHCAGCHQIERQGGAVGPDLSAFADKDPGSFTYANLEGGHSKQNWVIEHFKNPKKVSPSSPMHLPAMSDYQIECLASYVLSLSQRDFPRQYTPKLRAGFVPPRVDVTVPELELSSDAENNQGSE